jgi:hypothetical protein
MKHQKDIAILAGISQQLLAEERTQEELENLLNQAHAIFKEITQVSGFDEKLVHMAAIPTKNGKALGLNHAAKCLIDYKRTHQLFKGVVQAIRDAQEKKPGKTIQVFYAGCGPYAPFITLVAPLFTSDEVQFVLLDINTESLELAKKLVTDLGLSAYVKSYRSDDAVTLQIEEGRKVDVLISETLDALLYRECYVPILFNLLPQLSQDVALIPQNVQLKLSLYKAPTEDKEAYASMVGTLLDVRAAVKEHAINGTPELLSLGVLGLETVSLEQFDQLLLDTEVQVYKDLWLMRGDSDLTKPFTLSLRAATPLKQLKFDYQIKPDIELKYAFLS